MKRIAICFALMVSLVIPTASPANASEKCLASFADSEWANGTPSGVKSLLGFDLVEKISKTPEWGFSNINSFYIFGEHTEIIKYNYVGKNCTSRDIAVSRLINEQSVNFGFKTISDLINKTAPNFLSQENSTKYYSIIRDYFLSKTFNLKTKQILPQEENLGSTRGIQRYLINESGKLQNNVVWPQYAFIYFPSKCAYWSKYDDDGNETREKIYSGGVGRAPAGGIIKFESTGDCIAELRQGGGSFSVAEKIADIKYVVANASSITTVTCKKGKTTKKVKGTNPKCPTGYKQA